MKTDALDKLIEEHGTSVERVCDSEGVLVERKFKLVRL